jgi:hypothetical protein
MVPKLNIKKSEELKSFYSNHVNIHSSFFDFVFEFGEVERIETYENQNVMDIEIKTRIVMSPQHAKAFLKVLNDNLKEYEKNFGEIKLPDGGGK